MGGGDWIDYAEGDIACTGLYMGLIGMVWAVAAASGPPIGQLSVMLACLPKLTLSGETGGAFSDSSWRWLFCE